MRGVHPQFRVRHAVFALGWLACAMSAAQAQQNPFEDSGSDSPAVEYYRPAQYVAEGRLPEYVTQAKTFLIERPDSPQAPEAAAELLMAAIVLRDADSQGWARTRLLIDHPQSFGARFAAASFPDEESCRDFLKKLTDSLKENASVGRCTQLARALELCVQAWGPKLISDDPFVLECSLIAYATQHAALQQLCQANVAQCTEETRTIAQIAFENSPLRDKVLLLHRFADSDSAQLYERFFYGRLTDEERRQREMLKVAAETHLRERNFAEALPLIDQILASGVDPQVLYWRGWCLAVTGRMAESQQVMDTLSRDFSDSDWAAPAERVAEIVRGADAALQDHARQFSAVIDRMRGNGLDQLEIRGEFRTGEIAQMSSYLGLDVPGGRFESLFAKDEKTLVAFRTTKAQSSIYFAGEPMITHFQETASLPVPNAHLSRTDAGRYRLQFSGRINSGSRSEDLSQARNSLLDSPVLASAESIAELLAYMCIRNGWLPERVENGESGAVLRWTSADLETPQLHRWECRIASADSTICIENSESSTRLKIRHGPAGSFALSPPPWPDLPHATKEKMDPATLFRLIAAAAQLVSNEQSATTD